MCIFFFSFSNSISMGRFPYCISYTEIPFLETSFFSYVHEPRDYVWIQVKMENNSSIIICSIDLVLLFSHFVFVVCSTFSIYEWKVLKYKLFILPRYLCDEITMCGLRTDTNTHTHILSHINMNLSIFAGMNYCSLIKIHLKTIYGWTFCERK